jgi:hypothetical protein
MTGVNLFCKMMRVVPAGQISSTICSGVRFARPLQACESHARKPEFVEAIQSDLPRPVVFEKIFRFAADPNQIYIPGRPTPHRGAFRDRHGRRVRDAVDASGASDEGKCLRTAKSCGPDTPTLVSSVRKVFRRRRWQKSPVTGESAI